MKKDMKLRQNRLYSKVYSEKNGTGSPGSIESKGSTSVLCLDLLQVTDFEPLM